MERRSADPELPWGCWLELRRTSSGTVIVDEDGREYPSVRDAFWRGRLRMVSGHDVLRDSILELLHTVLARYARMARSRDYALGRTDDLFWHGGQLDLAGYGPMFHAWLAVEGILAPPVQNWWETNVLTDEGWSVLMMLDATRPDPVRGMRPGTPSLEVLMAATRTGQEDREEWRRKVEHLSAQWPARFVRRTLAGMPIVELMRDFDHGTSRRRTVWSMPFHDEKTRDAFFDWLSDRVDRWPKFASLACTGGGIFLAHHIVELMSKDVGERRRDEAPPSGPAPTLSITDQR